VILLLDNYDSFSFILKDYLQQCGEEVVVFENNDSIEKILEEPFKRVVFSPGPKTPRESGNLMNLIEHCDRENIPSLGVCLGHQAIGEFYGARLEKALKPMHGKVCTIRHEHHPLFSGIPNHYEICRYHSLVINALENTPLEIIAESADHEVMAVAHRTKPLWGVQFHPEAILTSYGLTLLKNWLTYCRH
jgi:anthranilate synthase/aminodeoxychorismate synthase-like glutamine amidotransferase